MDTAPEEVGRWLMSVKADPSVAPRQLTVPEVTRATVVHATMVPIMEVSAMKVSWTAAENPTATEPLISGSRAWRYVSGNRRSHDNWGRSRNAATKADSESGSGK